ncbi:MAG: heavy-metal-associated domain-containing protein [Chloroflexi bacterium]|nr:heavy-metal-associated domain-containing protein [Chloroflexota bacterium]
MERIVLTAPDISCDHCINAITKAVGSLEGVESVDGSPDTKQVTVVFDAGRVSLEAIKEAMEEEGYPVAG